MKLPILISVFEDNRHLRESIVALLKGEDDFHLCGAFPDCTGLREHLHEAQPDLLLMDIDMPGINGIEGLKLALAARPETIVVMYTIFEDDEKVYNAICNGARGYILKKTSNDKLIESLKEMYAGGSVLTPAIARRMMNFLRGQKNDAPDFHLTDRETEILQSLVDGYSYKMIAGRLSISLDTVRSHIKNLYGKLQVNSNVEAVKRAMREKLV